MIQLLRRIGFPPFKRTRAVSTSYHSMRHRRFVSSEPLESRVLLAAHPVTDLPSPGFALLSALSRGGDALMAQAGIERSATLADSPINDPVDTAPIKAEIPESDEAVQTVVTTDDAPDVVVSLDPAPQPLKATAEAEAGDIEIQVGKDTFVIYNSLNGNLRVESESMVTTLEIISKSAIFTGEPGQNLTGPFDVDEDGKIFKLVGTGFQNVTFGNVAQQDLTEEFIRQDLLINGSNAYPDPNNPGAFLTGGLSNKHAKLRLQVVSGSPILEFNEEFVLRIWVEDTRPTDTLPQGGAVGVFAAYMDIEYDPTLADVIGDIEFSDDYEQVQSGTISDGLINEIGAVATSGSGLSQSEILLAEIRMRAEAAGELVFTVSPADVLPAHDTLLFGEMAPTDPLNINYQNSQTLTVNDTPTAPDLVQFAKDLEATGAVFWGAAWCPHCTDQKELFQDGQEFLPFKESTNPDRSPTQESIDNNISTYPTWVFADGSRLTGAQSLEALADAAGISIPESNRPHLAPIEDTTLLSGSPLHVSLDGYDPNGGPLTYTVTSDNPDLVSPTLINEGRSAVIDVEGYGKMLFHLFEQRATRATDRMVTLAENDFYDDLIFHRVMNNFVIQGGDPNGDGTGGSNLPDFDDQFHVDLQHNRTGLLSMAKGGDDTNNSQFFITEGSSRHLDFNHTIFGVMVEGEKNRDAISNTAVNGSTPVIPIAMRSIDIVTDTENGVVMLKANEGATGSANITVTVTDAEGHTFQQTFAVDVEADTANGGPFLDDIPELTTDVDTPIQYQLTAQDVEGDDVTFSSFGASNATVDLDPDTGLMTITPDAGFFGTAFVGVQVAATNGSDTQDTYDSQVIALVVPPNAPTVELLASSDSGASDTDGITNLTNLQFEISNVANGSVVELFADGQKIGEGTADGDTIVITTANLSAIGDGVYDITARQTFDDATSEPSDILTVELDQTAPGNFDSTAPTSGVVGDPIDYDAEHAEEGDVGFVYSLDNAPTGAAIDPDTGEFSWTPTRSQVGAFSFDIMVTDLAGNTNVQTVNLDVMQTELIRYRLQAANLSGEAITSLASGQSFLLQVYVEDIRTDVSSTGVRSAYLDITYDATAVRVDGAIQYGADFANNQLGDTSTDGSIEEAGASTDTDLGSGEFLLMSIPMASLKSGITSFDGNAAETLDTMLVGIDDGLFVDQLAFEGDSLNVVSSTFATDDEFDVLEDQSNVALDVLDNDISVPVTRTLTIVDASGTSNGTVAIRDGVEVVYTPDSNFFGQDSFTYTIRDDGGDESTATVTVNVAPVNDAPTATDDAASAQAGAGVIVIDVLDNDSSAPDSDETLTIIDVSAGSNGGSTNIVSGTQSDMWIEYEPDDDFSGMETFTYTISDGNGGEATATVTVTVTKFVPGGVKGNLPYSQYTSAFVGVPVTLSRVDSSGSIERVAQTDNLGQFFFDSLVPGQYQLSAPRMPFTTMNGDTSDAGVEVLNLSLSSDGLNGEELNFSERALSPRFSLWDALASSSDEGFYTSVNTNSGHDWSRVDDGWEGAQVVDVAFSGDESELTITIMEDDVVKVATVARSDRDHVQIVGSDGDSRLVRIRGARSAFDFQEAAEAEGEDARDEVFANGAW